jgi:iron complex transport system substrate-binding protein
MIVPGGEKVTEAQVASAGPDVMVLAWAATGAKADPVQAYKVMDWKNVPAIRNRRVHVISDELLNTPGPPLIEGVRALYNTFYAENPTRTRGPA